KQVTTDRFRSNNLIRAFSLWFFKLNISNGHFFMKIKVMIITERYALRYKCDRHHIKRPFLFENDSMSSFRTPIYYR
ncbi:TPA: hypothetical protein ACIWEK_003063, partial [Salmonella enterica subsp. enterica serovar Enteritidis]